MIARAAGAERDRRSFSYNTNLKAYAVVEAKLTAFCQAAEAIGLSDTAQAFRWVVQAALDKYPFPPDRCGTVVYKAWKHDVAVFVLQQELGLDLSQV